MKRLKILLSGHVFWIAVSVILFATLGTLCAAHIFRNEENLPAWAQAFGAIAGMGIAIWVPHRQSLFTLQQAEIKTLQDELSLLTAINAEITVEFEIYMENVGDDLSVHDENTPYNTVVPIEHYGGFPIYRGNATKIASICNEKLRLDIIRVYAIAGSMEIGLAYNNELSKKYNFFVDEVANHNYKIMNSEPYLIANGASIGYAKALVTQHKKVTKAVDEIKEQIREEISYLSDFIKMKRLDFSTERRVMPTLTHPQEPELPT